MLHSFRHRFTPTLDKVATLAMLYAVLMVLCLWAIARFPFQPERLLLYFIAPLLPFFLAGMVLSAVFQIRKETTATLYFADLLGASLGALAVTFLLRSSAARRRYFWLQPRHCWRRGCCHARGGSLGSPAPSYL